MGVARRNKTSVAACGGQARSEIVGVGAPSSTAGRGEPDGIKYI